MAGQRSGVATAAQRYGGAEFTGHTTTVPGQLTALARPGPGEGSPLWHPDHPFFWFAVIAGAAVGLIGFSTTGRVGPVSANVDLGKK